MNIFRRFRKNLSLRTVNFLGLSVVFSCLLISAGYIRRELSYDRHHANAERIVRMTQQFDNKPVDGRIYGKTLDALLLQMPEIERTVKIHNIPTAVLHFQGKHCVINDFYAVNHDFLKTFDLELLYGDKNETLQRRGQALISESLAKQMFGELNFDEIQMSDIYVDSRSFVDTVFVSGIFKDIKETSHFHTDILLHFSDDWELFTYTYLLLNKNTNIPALAKKINNLIEEQDLYQNSKSNVLLMPLTDIHLRSHNLREMSVNGNIHYIYLVGGANLLLLIVVLFNLWLNASLIFLHNRRYYKILRICGAGTSEVFRDETWSAALLGMVSMIAGTLATFYVLSSGKITVQISFFELGILCPVFLLLTIVISLLPALKDISSTLFLNTNIDLKPIRFSYKNVRYMLTAQYAVVMIVVILAFGINKQMNLVKDTQVGGNDRNIIVFDEQAHQVQEKYKILKSELLKYTEIQSVTSCFQLPGDAIRDMVHVRKEDDENIDRKPLPVIVAGEDFLSFFRIQMIAGQSFSPDRYDFKTEETMLLDRFYHQKFTEHVEEYVINRKALATLGFKTAGEAVGQILWIEQGALDYFRRGVIVGVTDDFNYTGLYEETIPLLIMQRQMFQGCIMVRLDPDRLAQARAVFENVWNEVIPDFPANYVFMNDVFGRMYRNEINAQQLVYVFSLLCLIIADLGLIIFMAFIIRRRTKEIGIRKVYGASVSGIIQMLNMDFIRYIALAFAIATPVAWYVMQRWLERFAYRVTLDWWIFALAGLSVLLISVVSVSLQSWRAATTNPVRTNHP